MKKITKIWTTGKGKKVPICDMCNRHLLNAIKYLEKRAEGVEDELLKNAYNFNPIGEIAEITIENELLNIQENGVDVGHISPFYNDLCAEALSRGLKFNYD